MTNPLRRWSCPREPKPAQVGKHLL